MSGRIAIIHIGTHKTGTTALQIFFEANKQALRADGVLVAQGGRYQTLPGNHQVAWELLASDTSRHLNELLGELRASHDQAALVTSEDFSLLYARPRALEVLRDGIASAGFTPKIVVFLRSQAPYAESMYVERIKHDYVRPLGDYIETILRRGLYIPDGSPIHLEFEYTRLLAPFVKTFGSENVVVQPYVPNSDPLHIFRQFLAVMVSLNAYSLQTASPLQIPQARANEGLSFLGLLETAHRACSVERTAGLSVIKAIREIAPDATDDLLSSRVRLLGRSEILAFRSRFADDNEQLKAQFGVTLLDGGGNDLPPANDVSWDHVRTQRKIFDRLIDMWLKKRAASPQPTK